jgi:hypothetical protein
MYLIICNVYCTLRGGPEIANENIERIRMASVGFALNLSKGLSLPVRGHYRERATLTTSQKLKFLGRVPIHMFRARARELYGSTHNEVVREAKFDRICALDTLDLFRRKGDFQRFNILLQMLDLPAADQREHIWRLLQEVRDRDWSTTGQPDLALARLRKVTHRQ